MADVSEKELFLMLINGLTNAREAARGLGLKRGDLRWIKVANNMELCKDSALKLFDKAQGNRVIQ